MYKGYFLVVEGIGGSGKTSLCDSIEQWLKENNVDYIRTHEPGGTPAASELRVLCRSGIVNGEKLTPLANAMLYMTARVQHVETVIKPALEAGKVVLCDRYVLTTYAYQGAGERLSRFTLEQLHHHAIGLMPNKTIVIQGDAEVFNARVSDAEKLTDQFDAKDIAYQDRLQFEFDRTAEENPKSHWIVDGEDSKEGVFEQVVPLLVEIRDNLEIPKRSINLEQFVVEADKRLGEFYQDSSALSRIIPGYVSNKGL